MEGEAYNTLKNQIALDLNDRKMEFSRKVAEIGRNFRDLGLETAVWYPKKIHFENIGGLDAESYLGYSRIEGKWGLKIRTIERDCESRALVRQRVYSIESSRNVKLVVNALKYVGELREQIDKITAQEAEILLNLDGSFPATRKS